MLIKILIYMISSMAISIIFSQMMYWRHMHAMVRFEDLILTGEQFVVAAAASGLFLSFLKI